MAGRDAVLLMAYGGAERVEELPAYLRHIRLYYSRMTGGGEPTAEELEDLVRRYRAIGGSSPLLKITASLSRRLEDHLRALGHEVSVYYGMKHSKPFIDEVFDEMVAEGAQNVLGLVLAPHYSVMSVKGYHDALIEANRKRGEKAKLTLVYSWHLDPVFIDRLAKRVREAKTKQFDHQQKVCHVFTAHSLPEKILEWGDPYPVQLKETVEALAAKLGLREEEYRFAYQSASGYGGRWLGPDVQEELGRLKREGWTNILVAPIGFVCDHLEILYDIDVELRRKAEELGLRLARIEMFNDSQDFVEVLASVIRRSGFLDKRA